MMGIVDEAFVIMINNLKSDYNSVSYVTALAKENEVNDFRDFLRSEHFENIEKQEYNVKSGIFYSDLFYSLEKVGDHIMNVTEAVVGNNIVGDGLKV
jgi:phosphate:Na+ symporter